jgi:8-oxo-dGTP diphosphatase
MSEHLTNIVAVAIIYNDDHKVLVARRAATKSFMPGQFECVGGHLDPGEQPAEGLQREVREEMGCEIVVGRLIDAFTYESENTWKVELSYLSQLQPGQTPTLNPDDHSEFRWIGSDEIDKFEKQDQETEVLRKAFKILKEELA